MVRPEKNAFPSIESTPEDGLRSDVVCAKIIDDVCRLLDCHPDKGYHWSGTMTDLLEMAHIAYRSGDIRDDMGRPARFKQLVETLCRNLHLTAPHNPNAYVCKADRRKNITQQSMHNRYRYQLSVGRADFMLDTFLQHG